MLDLSDIWTVVTYFLIFHRDLKMFYTNYSTNQFKCVVTPVDLSYKLLNLLNLRNLECCYIFPSKPMFHTVSLNIINSLCN